MTKSWTNAYLCLTPKKQTESLKMLRRIKTLPVSLVDRKVDVPSLTGAEIKESGARDCFDCRVPLGNDVALQR